LKKKKVTDGFYQIKVSATDKQSAHTAKMGVKFGKVAIKKSSNKTLRNQSGSHSTYIVEVKRAARKCSQ
jgi:hypothetical protein